MTNVIVNVSYNVSQRVIYNVPGVDGREEAVAEEPIVYRQIPEPPVYVQARGIPPWAKRR